MRSTWSAETVLAVLAAATVEAAALTLAYLAVNWLSGRAEITVGAPAFAVAVVLGLVLAARLRRASWKRYLVAVPAAVIVTGALGGWLSEALAGEATTPVGVLGDAAAWLLGIAVLRGTAHAELDDEAYVVNGLLRIGMPGLAVFWIVAASSGLPASPPYLAAAFGATLTFVSSALLALGLGRLRQLRVEAVDQVARRRWLALLLGVTSLVLLVGIPLGALLQVPLTSVLAGAGGPLATVVIVVFVALAAPLLLILSAIADTIGPVDFHFNLPSVPAPQGNAAALPPDVVTVVVLVFGAVVAVELLAVLVVATILVRRSRRLRGAGGPELRESEPIELALRLPRLRRRRAWSGTPATAVDAYRLALGLLAGREEGRQIGETPREHAGRVRGSPVGSSMARLAADYQLAALAGRRLTEAEERRAQSRFEQIRRFAR